jgi:hypothetical protein
MMREA